MQEPQTSTGPRYSKLARPKYSVLPHLRSHRNPPEGSPESPANPKAHDASNQILGLDMCRTHPDNARTTAATNSSSRCQTTVHKSTKSIIFPSSAGRPHPWPWLASLTLRGASMALEGSLECFSSHRQKNRRPEGSGGAGRDRTDDLKLAKLPLSQLSYGPLVKAITAKHSTKQDGGPGKI